MNDFAPSVPVWEDPRVIEGMKSQWGEMNRQGVEPVGWKLGLGTGPMLELLGTSGPLLGYLGASTELEDGAVVDTSGWNKPLVEPELAIYMGADLAPGSTEEQASASIAGLGIAFELIDVELPFEEVEKVLATDIFHRHYILGETRSGWSDVDADDIRLKVTRGGDTLGETDDPQSVVGDLVGLVKHVADYLGAFGQGLQAGQFLITGSVTPPLALEPGDQLEYEAGEFGKLRVDFA